MAELPEADCIALGEVEVLPRLARSMVDGDIDFCERRTATRRGLRRLQETKRREWKSSIPKFG